MPMNRNVPVVTLTNVAKWAEWLAREAETSDGVWIALTKKGCSTAPTTLTYEEALDEALCHGWIDGPGFKRNETTYIRRFTPRRPRSVWSQRNVGYIARLEKEGRLQPRGRLEVEKAKADGRWDAAYSQANLEPPADLLAAIAAVPEAQAQWDILTKTNKFAICFPLMSMKTQAGREKRLVASVEKLARGETHHPQKRVRETVETPEVKPKSKSAVAGVSMANPSVRRSKRLRETPTETSDVNG